MHEVHDKLDKIDVTTKVSMIVTICMALLGTAYVSYVSNTSFQFISLKANGTKELIIDRRVSRTVSGDFYIQITDIKGAKSLCSYSKIDDLFEKTKGVKYTRFMSRFSNCRLKAGHYLVTVTYKVHKKFYSKSASFEKK